ncbi:hypothetical protein OH77DRAFT_1587018 [Trametes cingulata]|nr:hypothetical protein OH77DRAFT_1587018 [Trametes cingulata]
MPHPVLSNPDILFEIFRQIAQGPEDAICLSRATLAGCARVCKVFTDSAQRVLWERLPSVFPLLNLLRPQFTRLVEGREDMSDSDILYDTYVLHDIPDARQWARFCHYAARVRVLSEDFHADSLEDSSSSDSESDDSEPDEQYRSFIVPSVWVYLGRLSQGRPLLPAIRELNWTSTGPDQTELFLLSGPLLQTLRLHFRPLYGCSDDEYEMSLPLLARTIASISPNIREFVVTSEEGDPVYSAIHGVDRMKHLRTLRVDHRPAVEAAHFGEIAETLHNLEELEALALGLCCVHPIRQKSTAELRALKSLSITDYSGKPEAYTVFHAPNLRSLSIEYVQVAANVASCVPVSQALARQFPAITSLALTFWLSSTLSYPRPISLNLADGIAPLLSLPNVVEFSLQFSGGTVDLPNQDVHAMIAAWPHLSSLSIALIGPKDDYTHIRAPSIAALMDVARTASRLKTIRLSHLRLAEEELQQDLAIMSPDTQPLCCRSLEVLTVDVLQYPPKQKHKWVKERLALLVHGLFPSLDVRQSRLHTRSLGDESRGDRDDRLNERSRRGWNSVLAKVEAMRRSAGSGA